MVEFEDGTCLDTEDWGRIKSVIAQRTKEGLAKPVRIQINGLSINVKNLIPNGKGRLADHLNYIESSHRDWKIRVWTMKEQKLYGCNFYKGEEIQYLEVPVGDVRDENGVFKLAIKQINNIEGWL